MAIRKITEMDPIFKDDNGDRKGEKMRNIRVRNELRQMASAHGGLLNPPDVVEFASDPDTALHSLFTWDDTEAARQYRLWQARHIIATVHVMIFVGSGRAR